MSIALFTLLADGTLRSVQQTLWDLIGDLEERDLKATHGRASRLSLTEKSFKHLNAAAGLKFELSKHVGIVEKGRFADLVAVVGTLWRTSPRWSM